MDIEKQIQAGIDSAVDRDPDYKYKIMSRVLFEDGYDVDYDVDAFNPETWEDADEYWLKFTDNLSDWAFAICDDNLGEDDLVMFYFSPNDEYVSDEHFSTGFVEKLIQPHFKQKIGCEMESLFSVEGITEEEVVRKLKALGIAEKPRNWDV